MASVQDLLEKCRHSTTIVYGNLGRWPHLVRYYQHAFPYTYYFEPSCGIHIPKRWGGTLVVFTSHLDLTWDDRVEFRLFHVGRLLPGSPWDQFRPHDAHTLAVDASSSARIEDAYVQLLSFIDFYDSATRPEWRFVCPRAWKLRILQQVAQTQTNLRAIPFQSRNVDESLERHYALDETLPVWQV